MNKKFKALKVTITCDRNFNEIKRDIEETEDEIDFSPLAAAFAEEILKHGKKAEA